MADAAFDAAVARMKAAVLAQDTAHRRVLKASADFEAAQRAVDDARAAVHVTKVEVEAAHDAFQVLVKESRVAR